MSKGKLLPKIPIPAPEQFVQYYATTPTGNSAGWDECHCLVGWVCVACGLPPSVLFNLPKRSKDGMAFLTAMAAELGLDLPQGSVGVGYIVGWFDSLPTGSDCRPEPDIAKKIANAWVKTAREFDYDV